MGYIKAQDGEARIAVDHSIPPHTHPQNSDILQKRSDFWEGYRQYSNLGMFSTAGLWPPALANAVIAKTLPPRLPSWLQSTQKDMEKTGITR